MSNTQHQASPIQNAAFRRLWFAVFVSVFGDVLFTIGVLVLVYERTNSALQAVLVSVATVLPPFMLGPIAGYYVDRLDRRHVMVTMDVLRVLAVLTLLVWQDIGLLYTVVVLLSVANGFYFPARMSIIPSIVERHQLVQANSILTATQQSVMGMGYIFAGVMTSYFDFTVFVVLDALTFGVAAVMVATITLTHPPDATEQIALLPALRSGFDYLRDHRLPRALLLMETFEHSPHGLWSAGLFLVFVERALNGTATEFGIMASVYFLGEVSGALLATRLSGFIAANTGRIIVVNTFLFSLWTLLFALSPTVYFACAVTFLFGPSQAMRDVGQNTLLQTTVPQAMLGRIYAVREMGWRVSFTFSAIVLATLSDYMNVRYVYLLGACLYVMVGLYAATVRDLRGGSVQELEHATVS